MLLPLWQMVLPLMIDKSYDSVADGIATSMLADILTKVADGIATYLIADVIATCGRWNGHIFF